MTPRLSHYPSGLSRALARSDVLLPGKFFARRDGLMWGRLAACGRLRVPSGRGPASGARLRARRSGPRQPGTSRAVGFRLCCSVRQVVNLRPRPEGTRNRPGELVSPAYAINRPLRLGASRPAMWGRLAAQCHLNRQMDHPALIAGRAIVPAAAFQAAFSSLRKPYKRTGRRLKAGGSQDWLSHNFCRTVRKACLSGIGLAASGRLRVPSGRGPASWSRPPVRPTLPGAPQ